MLHPVGTCHYRPAVAFEETKRKEGRYSSLRPRAQSGVRRLDRP